MPWTIASREVRLILGHSLLRAAREAEKPGSIQHGAIVEALRDEHIQAAERCIRSKELLQELTRDIREDCRDLLLFLEAASVSADSIFSGARCILIHAAENRRDQLSIKGQGRQQRREAELSYHRGFVTRSS